MRKLKLATAILLAAGAMSAAMGSVQSTKPAADYVAKVNGVTISQEDLNLLLKERIAQGQADSPELRKQLRDELVVHELVAQEAAKKGLDKRADLLTEIRLAKQNVLFNGYMQDFLDANPISDAAAQKEYDDIRTRQGEREFHIRHIQLGSEAVTKYLIGQLKKGEPFGKLASDVSADEATRAKGGELDWLAEGNFPKPFSEAIVKLKKGQFTAEPVQSDFGWHIIKLEDERPIVYPPFEEIKDKIKQNLQQHLFDEQLANLQANAKVE